MATVTKKRTATKKAKRGIPELHNGDRLTQPEFHRRYEQYPEDVKFELIGGIVYIASPLRIAHAEYDSNMGTALGNYSIATPGVQTLQNATLILDPESEPQPDLVLRILPEYGGRTQTTADDYVSGGTELIVEIAHSSVAIDLHAKRETYRLAGVQEYLVVCVDEEEVRWFDLPNDCGLPLDATGILRSRVFPGLWLDTVALLSRNGKRMIEVLQQGLASRDHAQFVKQLESRFKKYAAGQSSPPRRSLKPPKPKKE